MGDSIFRFQQFPVYRDIREFRKTLKRISRDSFPREEQFCLTSQLWRALDSMLLNIAEGSERYSDIDFSRFLNTAIASLTEVVSCLDAALDDGYISKITYDNNVQDAEKLYRQLRAFCAKVRNSS